MNIFKYDELRIMCIRVCTFSILLNVVWTKTHSLTNYKSQTIKLHT